MSRPMNRRFGKEVFRVPDDIYRKCLEHGVTSNDIMNEKKKFAMLGIDCTYSTAAAAALKEKTRLNW